MEFKLPHKFSRKSEAQINIRRALDNARPQLPKEMSIEEERWEGDTLHFAFTVNRQHITGSLLVKEREYDIQVKLPLMLRLFEGRIKREIEAQAAQMLG